MPMPTSSLRIYFCAITQAIRHKCMLALRGNHRLVCLCRHDRNAARQPRASAPRSAMLGYRRRGDRRHLSVTFVSQAPTSGDRVWPRRSSRSTRAQTNDSYLECAGQEHGDGCSAAGSCELNLELRMPRFEFAESFIFVMSPPGIIVEFIKYNDRVSDVWCALC